MHFFKKIFSPICLLISSLLLFYTFFKSEIYWDGEKKDYYTIYYIISFICLIFSIFTFFLSQKIKEYLIIFTFSFVISLYLFELYLNLDLVDFDKHRIYKKQTGKKFEVKTRFQIYEELKLKNNLIKPVVSPKYCLEKDCELFPLSGISNSETIFCNELGYFSIYESDRYGFNNPDFEWDKNEIEYFLVGDSYTHGACVNRPNDIASILRTLSNKSALNLGYGGNGPLIEYATLREYSDLNIKNIFFIYYEGNDLFELDLELQNKTLNNYLKDLNFTQNLKEKQNLINESVNNTINEVVEIKKLAKSFKLKLFKFLKMYNLRVSIFKPPNKKPRLRQTELKKILKLADDLANQNGSNFYFVYLPEYKRYTTKYDNEYYLMIKDIIKELNISFIDIHSEVFKKEKKVLKLFPFEKIGHYNEEGYKKVAETLYQFTKDK